MKTRPVPTRSVPVPDDGARRVPPQGHVIICGFGNLGFRIYTQLDVIGVPLVVIHPAPDPQFASRVQAGADTLLVGDARMPEVLQAASIATASALITTSDDDLANLEIVLNAARLRPDLRIVMRLFNIDLAPTIAKSLPNVRLLSLSALAAPAFVAAATDPYARNAMLVDEQMFSVAEIPLSSTGTLERLTFGNAVVLAWRRGDDPPLLFPPVDQPVSAGDHLTVIGPAADVRALPHLLDHVPEPPHRHTGHRASMLGQARTLFRSLDRALYLTLAVLGLVMLASVIVFAAARHIRLLDAVVLVFGVISSTGIGWSEAPADPDWLKYYILGLIVAGTAGITIIYAFVTNYIVSVKLSGIFGQQRVRLQNHIVLCGMGTVGYRVLTGLEASGEEVAVVEKNTSSRFLQLARATGKGVPILIGDARLHEMLTLANVAAARCIICATSDDMANLQTALNARQLQPHIRVVIRMFDGQMAQQVAETFGFEVALSASALAAPAFVAAALGQTVVHGFRLAGHPLAVARLTVPSGSPIAGGPLGRLLEGLVARVLYYTPAGLDPYYHPLPSAQLAAGDALLVIAPESTLREISRRLAAVARPVVARAAGR